MNQRVVFHIDFDYFYAQCEEIREPHLKTKPVVVCVYSDRGGDSGAVATANYTARNYGVKSGIPIKLAKQKLNQVQNSVFLPVDFDYYSEISSKAMNVIKEYADIFEYVGRDEAYLDVSKKTDGNFQTASHLAQQLKNSVRDKIKITSSVGVSSNRLISKIASSYKKPDGLTVVTPEKVSEFLDQLKIREIPGIGKKTEKKFLEIGMENIGDVKKMDVFTLNQHFGRKTAEYIFNAVRGIDDVPVTERAPVIQLSKISTLKKDSKEYEFLNENLKNLCSELHTVVLKNNKMFRSVGIQFVQIDLYSKTKSKMLKNPTNSLEELQRAAEQLLHDALEEQKLPVRRLGVKVSELTNTEGQSTISNFF